ncbi:nicotinate-nucleotide adenylyltransferase [Gracilibacillus boraciitolerans JCM 21714]|uniref:Nicotinate-nucleotide adenylyltransferase n=1 Tax=Gracilibacillus boraciitolerans JCM 21714 TaxID=1298598 RepID=W4VMK8_9BACI|nr:nicotinate-nucleotide adenylyltransferase [Gracilibacillus boraciitolerans JCM 21714]
MITFVGINRPGYTLKSPYPVEEVQMPLMDISSTMIRERLKEGKTIRYLTPPAVIDIINKYKLYS